MLWRGYLVNPLAFGAPREWNSFRWILIWRFPDASLTQPWRKLFAVFFLAAQPRVYDGFAPRAHEDFQCPADNVSFVFKCAECSACAANRRRRLCLAIFWDKTDSTLVRCIVRRDNKLNVIHFDNKKKISFQDIALFRKHNGANLLNPPLKSNYETQDCNKLNLFLKNRRIINELSRKSRECIIQRDRTRVEFLRQGSSSTEVTSWRNIPNDAARWLRLRVASASNMRQKQQRQRQRCGR